MRCFLAVFVLSLALPRSLPAEDKPRDVPISKLGTEYRLIGSLHEPLGTVLTVQGVIVAGSSKEEAGKIVLRVQRIGDKATQEDITIEIVKGWTEFDTEIPPLKYGMSLELKGYETGEFVGTPKEVLKGLRLRPAVPGHHFRPAFVFHEAKQIDPMAWTPADFVGRDALIGGRAMSRDRKAYIEGKGWRLLVDAADVWPKEFEGKEVEGFGTVQKTDTADNYRLDKGTTRLVKLEDQLGRSVTLRGMALTNGAQWWLVYRGDELYVEGMMDLPGWTGDLHFRPVEITGVLDEAMLPDLNQMHKDKPGHRKQFIVRKPAWKALETLLSPERVGR